MKRLSLHHRLRNKKVRLNNTIGENVHLKTKIDIMRKEIIFAQDAINTMEAAIAELRVNVTNINKDQVASGRTAHETNNQILALKSKHESGKEKFEGEIQALHDKLKERPKEDEDLTKDLKDKTQEAMQGRQGDHKKSSFANPIEILKIRLNQVISKNE